MEFDNFFMSLEIVDELDGGENVLLFSEGNKINVIDRDRIVEVVERGDDVRAMCSYKGDFYDVVSPGRIFKNLSGEPVFESEEHINAICGFEGDVFYGGDTFQFDVQPKINAIGSEKSYLPPISDGNRIMSLCAHKGELYYVQNSDLHEDSSIRKVSSDLSLIHDSAGSFSSLCSIDGYLLCCNMRNIVNVFQRGAILEREDYVRSIVNQNGVLYDLTGELFTDHSVIRSTLKGRVIAQGDGRISKLCSHPRQYFVDMEILK